MDIKDTLTKEEFIKKFLCITLILCGLSIIFDILGFLMVIAIQWIAGVLILIAYLLLLLLTLIISLNVKADTKISKRIRILNYLLLLLISICPVLIGVSGMLANEIYFLLPNTIDGSLISSVLSVLSLIFLLGYGLGLTLLCYLKIDDRSIWKF